MSEKFRMQSIFIVVIFREMAQGRIAFADHYLHSEQHFKQFY